MDSFKLDRTGGTGLKPWKLNLSATAVTETCSPLLKPVTYCIAWHMGKDLNSIEKGAATWLSKIKFIQSIESNRNIICILKSFQQPDSLLKDSLF